MLLNIFRVRAVDREISKEVRIALLDTLYASKLSLAIGAASGVSTAGLIAYRSQNLWLAASALLLGLAGALRVISFSMFKRGSATAAEARWEIIYDLGAWAYAGLLGQLTFLTIVCTDDLSLHLLAGAVSTGYAAGAAGRNTGRPMIAVGQLMLCALPLSLALILHPSTLNLLLALINVMYVAVIIDITLQTYHTVLGAFIERQEKLNLASVYEKLARTDPLTGIDNRITLKQNLENLLRTSNEPVALIWIDLDGFKQINDTLGHAAGDVVLNAVAARLVRLAGTDGMLARFGGDEFIVVKPVSDAETALTFAEDMRAALGRPETADGTIIDISASIGVSVSELYVTSADDLLRHADMALYEAKSRGRNCVMPFNPQMEERLLKTKRIERDLKQAIENNELEVHFQPIVNIATGRTESCEALLRWYHPVHGEIGPGAFIPIAESTGQIGAITEWALNRACAAAMAWPRDVSVCVNISPALLKGRDLPPLVHEALIKQGLPPRRLELEITETVLVEDNPNIKIILDNFHRVGIRLSLDDFGTGYSSLSYLCKYKFHTLKIDKSFTADIHRSSEARAVIQAVSGIAESLNLTVVAEGIETQRQLDYIREHGCVGGQGYYFARPMTQARILEYLAREKAPPEPGQNVPEDVSIIPKQLRARKTA